MNTRQCGLLILSATAVGVCAGWLTAPPPPTSKAPVAEIAVQPREATADPVPVPPSEPLSTSTFETEEVEPLPDDVARILNAIALGPNNNESAAGSSSDISSGPSPLIPPRVLSVLDKLLDGARASSSLPANGAPSSSPATPIAAKPVSSPPRPLTPQLRLARILRDPVAADLYRRMRTVKLSNSNLRSSLAEQQQSQALDISAKVAVRRRVFYRDRPVGYLIGGSADTYVYLQQQFAYAQQREQAEEARMVDAMKRQHAIDNLIIENKILANETLLLGFQREFDSRGQTLESLGLLDQPR